MGRREEKNGRLNEGMKTECEADGKSVSTGRRLGLRRRREVSSSPGNEL